MKNSGKGTLAEKRAEINARYSEVKSWRKLSESDYPDVKPGTLCAVAGGYEPKRAKVLAALGLPILKPAPVCPGCGEVHIRKSCPNRTRKPCPPRTGPTRRQMRWLAIMGIQWGGEGPPPRRKE